MWRSGAHLRLKRFAETILGALWPGSLPELERALTTLSIALFKAVDTFMEHSCPFHDTDLLRAEKFYKIREWDHEKYSRLLKQYNEWFDRCCDLVFEATRAANWFADVVRRDVDPFFFADKGKFLVGQGPLLDGSSRTYCPEYTDEEKEAMPGLLEERFPPKPPPILPSGF